MAYVRKAFEDVPMERLKALRDKVVAGAKLARDDRDYLLQIIIQAIRAEEVRLYDLDMLANAGLKWSDDDTRVLLGTLAECGIAKSYATANNALEMAASRLKRSTEVIKKKAVEFGVADHIDWWLAREKHGLKDIV